MHPAQAPFWTKTPDLRLLLPLVAEIVAQWYGQFPLIWLGVGGTILMMAVLVFGQGVPLAGPTHFTAGRYCASRCFC